MGAKITVQNLSKSLSDQEAQAITAALSTQALKDYNLSSWVSDGHAEPAQSVTFIPKGQHVPSGTAHMEILDTSDDPGALGYHEEQAFRKHTADGKPEKASSKSERGLRADEPHLPLMKVFAKTTIESGGSVSEVSSHEMLEALVDPRPMVEPKTVTNSRQKRIYIVEVGDPVQETAYDVEGQRMANFVLPRYFGLPSSDSRVDFRGALSRSFALAPRAYFSWAPVAHPEAWQQSFGPLEGEALPPTPPVPNPPAPTPAPAPEPASPTADANDLTLWAAISPWAHAKHIGANKHAAQSALAWARAKGLA